MKEGDKVKILV